MKFKNVEEIESWFVNNKYDEEVHEAINFLLKENTKNKKARLKSTYRPKAKPLRNGL